MRRPNATLARRVRDDEEGVTLVEVMFAVLLLTVAIMALATTALAGLTNLRSARDREEATNAASARIEELRALPYDEIVLDPADPDVIAAAGCFDGETVVANAGVATPLAVETVVDAVTLRTFVTWWQSAEDADCAGPNDAERLAKRVTVVGTWQDGSNPRTVRQDTIVADAGRGLPVPEFDINPATAVINFDPAEVAAEDTICQRHQLRNLGAEDGYEWVLNGVTPSIGPPFKATVDSFRTANGNWTIKGYFQFPGTSTSNVPDVSDPTTELMADIDGNGRMETTLRVAEDGIANFWVCWKPKSSGPALGDTLTADISLHSIFDGARFESVAHTVSVGNAPDLWYLFDSNDAAAHARPGKTTGGTFTPDPYTMGPEDGIFGSTDNLGTINYANPALSNWDTNIDGDGLPGITLPVGNSTLAGRWHEQMSGATTIERNVELSLYVSSKLALTDGGYAGGDTLSLSVVLDVLRSNEKTVDATLLTVPAISVPLSTPGWTRIDISLDLGADRLIDAGKFLRLRVACGGASTAACQVAYDNTAYPSALAVNLR